MSSRSKIFYYFLFLLGTALLAGTVVKLGPEKVWESFLAADYQLILAGIGVYLLAVFFRSLRWYVLFRHLNEKISYFRFLPTYFVGLMVGNLTPFKSGEVVVPYLFKKNLKSKIGKGFTLIFFDRFFDILILILCMVVSFVLIGAKVDFPDNVKNLFWIAIILLGLFSIAIMLIFGLARKSESFFRRLAGKFKKRVFLAKISQWISREVVHFHGGTLLLKGSSVSALVLMLAVLSWGAEFFAFYFFVSSALAAPFWIVLAFQVLSIGIGIASFIPAGMGIGTVSFVFLISLTGYSVIDAGAGGVMAKIISLLMIYLAGVLGLIFTRPLNRGNKIHDKN